MRTRHKACIALSAIAIVLAFGPKAESQQGTSKKVAKKSKPAAKLDRKALAELTLEHSRSRDELLAAEARLGLLSEKLYNSRLQVTYQGQIDTPFQLSAVELMLDGTLAYRQEFHKAPTAQTLKLFDGFLPSGRHVIQLKVYARGPGEQAGDLPGYFSGSGLAVLLRENSVTNAVFEAEQDGDAPETKDKEPDGSWDVEIQARFETETK